MLDPFLPEDPADVARLKGLQREIHEDFIALVKSRRDNRLKGEETDLFSGEYWTGKRALALGLVDGVGDIRSTLRQRFGDKVYMPQISSDRGFLGRRMFGIGAGASGVAGLAEDMIAALEARALWARFGL
jgi:serine protease SohB